MQSFKWSILWLIYLQCTSFAQSIPPKIDFANTNFDFGKVYQGDVLEHEFEFSNLGGEDLVILGVNTSCGCTLANSPIGKAIKPKSKSSIRVSFDTDKFVGKTSKSIIVMTNEKLNPTKILSLSADIEERIIIDPPVLNLGRIKITDNIGVKTVKLTPKKNTSFNIGKIEYDRKKINVNYNLDTTSSASGEIILTINLVQPLKSGSFYENIIIFSKDSKPHKATLPITAQIVGPIQISESKLEFGTINNGQNPKRNVNLKADEPFDIERMSLELFLNGKKLTQASDYINLSVQKQDPLHKIVTIEVKNKDTAKGNLSGKITLNTNQKSQETIQLDIHGLLF